MEKSKQTFEANPILLNLFEFSFKKWVELVKGIWKDKTKLKVLLLLHWYEVELVSQNGNL